MTTLHKTKWITPDLLEVGAISLPAALEWRDGTTIEIVFKDGREGRLTLTRETEPDRWNCYWLCTGSAYHGRSWELIRGLRSDIAPLGHPIMVPCTLTLLPK